MKEDTGKPSNMRNMIIYAVFIIIGIIAYFIARPPLLSVSPDPPSLNFYSAVITLNEKTKERLSDEYANE